MDTEKHSALLKAKVALAAIRGDRIVAELKAEEAEGKECRANPSLKRENSHRAARPGNPIVASAPRNGLTKASNSDRTHHEH